MLRNSGKCSPDGKSDIAGALGVKIGYSERWPSAAAPDVTTARFGLSGKVTIDANAAAKLYLVGDDGLRTSFKIGEANPYFTSSFDAASKRLTIEKKTVAEDFSAASWARQRNNYANQRYSKLDQINVENAGKLKIGPLYGNEGTPLVVGNRMFLHTIRPNVVSAIDLDSELKLLWTQQIESSDTDDTSPSTAFGL